tara:strand:+ start:196 stop:522 length:327 start_codon:yes stop_codon:yes gene_type:complete
MSSASDNKKIVYYDSAKKHADLKIRLEYDGLKQSEFFRLLTAAYLERDDRLVSIIGDYKDKMNIHNREKRRGSQRMHEKSKETISKFSLGDEDVENIFDLLEKENPDL